MLQIIYKKQFIKDWKKFKSNPQVNDRDLEIIIDRLAKGDVLEFKYKDHALKGQLSGLRECHIKPNILLVYAILDEELVILRLGTHSQLFG